MVLYHLKTHSKIIRLALSLLVLGVDISLLQEAMEIRESDQGRGRKIGRATIIYEAALRGMKLLEKELFTYPAVAARMTKDEAGHVIIGPAPEEPVTALGDADDGAHLCS